VTGFSLYPPEVRFIVSCVPSRLLRRDWFPMGSSARWAINVPPARFLNARSNSFGYYAGQTKRHPKRVPLGLAFHATFDTIFIAVDERQQKHPSFSFSGTPFSF